MGTTILTFKAALESALIGGVFSLDRSAVSADTTPVGELLATLFSPPTLALTKATSQSTADGVKITGFLTSTPQANWPFLAGMMVKAVFRLDDAQLPQLHLTFTPREDQQGVLLQALPGWQNSLLGAFAWKDEKFEFDSASPALLDSAFPACYEFLPVSADTALTTGMQLTATVTYSGNGEVLSWLVGKAPISVSGPVAWAGAQPSLDLRSDPAQPLATIDVAGFTLPIQLHIIAAFVEIPAHDSESASLLAIPGIALTGTLKRPLDGKQPLEIPCAIVAVQEPQYLLRVVGNFEEASQLALAEVAQVLGITSDSIADQQPASFPGLEGLALKNIALTISPGRRELVMVSATVEFKPDNKWQEGNLIQFEDLLVTFTAIGPFSSPTLETVIDTTTQVGDGTLEAQISLPSLDFFCELESGSTLDLTELLNRIIGRPVFGSLKLICTDLRVSGNPSEGTYTFQAAVSDNWQVPGVPTKIALTSVGFSITHQAKPAASTSGQVFAQFEIAGMELLLDSDLPTATTGWTFTGSTMGDQGISLTKLLEDIADLFGLTLPSVTPKVTIGEMHMLLKTGVEESDPMDFGFSCEARISLLDTDTVITVEVGRTHDDPANPTTIFVGQIDINEDVVFEVDFNQTSSGSTLLFKWVEPDAPLTKWVEPDAPLTFEKVAQFFGFDMPPLPDGMDLALESAEFAYNFTNGNLGFSADSKNYGKVAFVAYKSDKKYEFFFGISIGSVNLSNLPLIGHELSDAVTVTNLAILGGSAPIVKDDIATVNALVGALVGADYPQVPAQGLTSTVALECDLNLGDTKPHISLGMGAADAPSASGDGTATNPPAALPAAEAGATNAFASASAGSSTTAPTTTPAAPDGVKWVDVQKAFGPVNFQKIGFKYADGNLTFLLSADLSVGGLTLSLQGASISTPLKTFSPSFGLLGLGINYTGGPVSIGGAFLKQTDKSGEAEYGGAAVIQAPEFSLAAVGAYGQANGGPSMFVYGNADGTFGGPPAFFVTGLIAGFGYNRGLRIPSRDEVLDFPLVQGLTNPGAIGGTAPTPMDVLGKLVTAGWITKEVGQNWLVAGVQFTSFDLVHSTALVIVEFGRELEVAVVGLSKAQFPLTGDKRYAYLELELSALYDPARGVLSIGAMLSPNSFLLDPGCKLTGGFAYDMWFSGSGHEGDFVLTLGGYHPAFTPPAHYPQVPRLGFNWPVSSHVSITGEAYLALTPANFMAGAGLAVVYQNGDLHAWFKAYADMLIWFHPFHFDAEIGMSVGASYRLNLLFTHVTVSVEMGATLHLWGPPTGGTVTIHWWVISFSVDFGADQPELPALTWSEFVKLLPAPDASAKIVAVRGLTGTVKGQEETPQKTWQVGADRFSFTATSAVPATKLFKKGKKQTTSTDQADFTGGPHLSIRPMQRSDDLTSKLWVSLSKQNESGLFVPYTGTGNFDDWKVDVITRNVPAALWGTGDGKHGVAAADAQLVKGQVVGCQLTVPPRILGASPGNMSEKALASDSKEYYKLLPRTDQTTRCPIQATDTTEKIKDVCNSPACDMRDKLATSLSAAGFQLRNGELTKLATAAATRYTEGNKPMLLDKDKVIEAV